MIDIFRPALFFYSKSARIRELEAQLSELGKKNELLQTALDDERKINATSREFLRQLRNENTTLQEQISRDALAHANRCDALTNSRATLKQLIQDDIDSILERLKYIRDDLVGLSNQVEKH